MFEYRDGIDVEGGGGVLASASLVIRLGNLLHGITSYRRQLSSCPRLAIDSRIPPRLLPRRFRHCINWLSRRPHPSSTRQPRQTRRSFPLHHYRLRPTTSSLPSDRWSRLPHDVRNRNSHRELAFRFISRGRSLIFSPIQLATFCYNWYKDNDVEDEKPSGVYLELATSEDGDTPSTSKTELDGESSEHAQTHTPSSSIYKPTIGKLAGALGFIILLASLVSLIPQNERSIKNDVKNFFAPQGIKPAAWDVPIQDPDCVRRYSGGGEVNHNSSFLADLDERIVESGCSVFPIPDAGLIVSSPLLVYYSEKPLISFTLSQTHLFWAGKWRDASHSMTLDAWLATQPWETSSSLIWWYEGAGPSEEWADKYTGSESPYRNVVSFRRFDEALAEGTCLTSMREWMDADYRKEIKLPVPTRSDLIRLLLLSKFGGIWLDADSIPLRDFTPLIRVGPVAPSYGGVLK